MRPIVLLAAMTVALHAQAQTPLAPSDTGARPGNEIGTGQSLPLSNNASNILPSDTNPEIAPRLPAPELGPNATPQDFLRAARSSLLAGRTGETQEALERATTRALDRVVLASEIGDPSRQPIVLAISAARDALGAGDKERCIQLIGEALKLP